MSHLANEQKDSPESPERTGLTFDRVTRVPASLEHFLRIVV